MEGGLFIARMALAAVLAVAGTAKLADLAGARRAVGEFGVPAALAPAIAVLLPLAELGVALALVPDATGRVGAAGALALLTLFALAIGWSLARGRRPDCHCFGQLHSAPAGGAALARNLVLAVPAGLVLAAGPGHAAALADWAGDLPAGAVAGMAGGAVVLGVILAQWWVLTGVLRQNGRLMLRVEALEARLGVDGGAAREAGAAGPAAGTPAPGFSLPGVDGEERSLPGLLAAGRPVLLVFSDPACGPCGALLPEIGRWQEEHAGRLTVAVVTRGDAASNRAKAREHGIDHMLLDGGDDAVHRAYGAQATPSAALVAPGATLATLAAPPAAGAEAIRGMVAAAAAGHLPGPRGAAPALAIQHVAPAPAVQHVAPPPAIGHPAPALRLPGLDGGTVDLAQSSGAVVVLFWDPGCRFCADMLAGLRAWESAPQPGAPALLVVAAGSADDNRAQGFRSPVALDPGGAAMRRFGGPGTPSAVLVDPEGRVASEVAVGAPAVMALCRGEVGAPARP